MTTRTDDTDWSEVAFVRASDYRTRVLDALTDGPATPTELGERASIDLSHISRTLTELRDHDIAELLVPEERTKGRIYGLTDADEAVATEVDA